MLAWRSVLLCMQADLQLQPRSPPSRRSPGSVRVLQTQCMLSCAAGALIDGRGKLHPHNGDSAPQYVGAAFQAWTGNANQSRHSYWA